MDLADLRGQMRGELIEAQHPAYETGRAVYNGAIACRPRAIARCADVADVRLAVELARGEGLLLAVRGGGHSGAGLGVCDDGLVIDLSSMRSVRVDPAARTIRAEGGCRLSDLDHAGYPFGLAVPGGIVASTGMGGLTLGGGHGYLSRMYGLTVDNLLQADVLLADGRLVSASPEENSDLFWAIRGGGGNFGVVTSFLYRARPVSQVFGGVTFWPIEHTASALRWYRDFIAEAPRELYAFFLLAHVLASPAFPEEIQGRAVCGMVWCYLGPPERGDEAVAPAREHRAPLFEHLGLMPLPVLNSMFDPLYPPGLQWYWKGHFVSELSEEAIAVHADLGARLPSLLSTMHLYPIDGAASRVARDQTAFAYRDAKWSMVIAGIDPDPMSLPRIGAWARSYWEALRPYSAAGGYVNFMQEESSDRVRATYRENYPRLAEIKTKYDPANLFRVNWNIKPGAER